MTNKTPASERPWLDAARRKRKIRVTGRMRKYIKGRAEGKIPSEAARDAGYPEPAKAAYWLQSSNSVIQASRQMLAEGEIGQADVIRVLKEGLAAERSVYVLIQDERAFVEEPGTKGREEEERKRGREPKKTLIKEEDWHARHKFVESIISIAGLRPEIQQRIIVEGQVDVSVAHTHLVIPVVPSEMLDSMETLSSEEKMRLFTERARKRLTGTLVEDPVELKPLEAKVVNLPPSNEPIE